MEADPLTVPALEGERMSMRADGQDWWVSWHGPAEAPPGTPHGAAGVCVGPEGELVLISPDGREWTFPAGRPEGDETHEETLRRELREEACVEVLEARLLGYSRGECVQGHELGLVLVRSFWRRGEDRPCQPRAAMSRGTSRVGRRCRDRIHRVEAGGRE